MAWIIENIGSIAVCALLVALVAGIIVYKVRQKKQGKASCGCGCGSCPHSGSCQSSVSE